MKILIAEDDQMSRMVLETRLSKWGYDVIAVEDGTRAMVGLMEENAPQLAILDWMMPGMDGLQVCREIRKQTERPYVYILLLTAKNQKEDLVEAMAAGADDYIAKPPDNNELEMRLRAGKRIVKLQDELRHQTTHDFLTGLLNRFAIMAILEKEINRSKRNGSSLSLAIADIDKFKSVNDTFGHQAGDAVLCEVADRMTYSLRSYDAVSRYGGEEFLLVFPECNEKDAVIIAEKVRLSVSDKPVIIPEGTLSVTASFGVTTINPSDGIDVDTMIRIADEALYSAKSNGRNRVEFIDPGDFS